MNNVTEVKEKHACMGLNDCKALGAKGENDCAGMGKCSTVNHPCHTLNACKGLGGCGLFGTTEEFCFPTENECRYQGSCGAPILDSRFIMQGPNKGRSVWLLARQRFEEKRKAAGKTFGNAPEPFGPSNKYINDLNHTDKDNSACGQSGNRECSYIADKKTRDTVAKQHVMDMAKESVKKMNETLATCPKIDA